MESAEKTASYESFAAVYDSFMDNVPYEAWSQYLTELLHYYGIDSGIVLELGCGTGTMTEYLSRAGYDMIGVDNSVDMLQIAMEKNSLNGTDILYLCQDMREFELYGTVEAVVSVCDSMNYITEPEDFVRIVRLVNNYLEKGGYFIFDLNTIYKYQTLLGDHTFAEDREEMSFIWQNFYDEASCLNEYDVSFFVADACGKYDKFQETHYQRAYSLETIQDCIRQGGMDFVAAYDAFTWDPPGETSERIYVIAKEKFNPKKTYRS